MGKYVRKSDTLVVEADKRVEEGEYWVVKQWNHLLNRMEQLSFESETFHKLYEEHRHPWESAPVTEPQLYTAINKEVRAVRFDLAKTINGDNRQELVELVKGTRFWVAEQGGALRLYCVEGILNIVPGEWLIRSGDEVMIETDQQFTSRYKEIFTPNNIKARKELHDMLMRTINSPHTDFGKMVQVQSVDMSMQPFAQDDNLDKIILTVKWDWRQQQ